LEKGEGGEYRYSIFHSPQTLKKPDAKLITSGFFSYK